MAGKGGPAQARRRARREAARKSGTVGRMFVQTTPNTSTGGATVTIDVEEFRFAVGADALSAAASGSSSLPLSEQDAAWDSGAAEKTLDPGQFGDAHFWKDPDGPADEVGSYKLPFAEVVDGKLTAVWKGVTGAAGAVQGARGGVKIPDGDVAGVKSKIAGYYAKAAKKYDDDQIKVPWESASVVAAAGDVAWAPESGFQDLLCDLNGILNPSGNWDYPLWVCDVSTDLTRVLIANWDGGGCQYYVAPVTVDGGKEPVLSQRSDWVEVEQAWVESIDESLSANLRTQLAARALHEGADGDGVAASGDLNFTLNFTTATGPVVADGATAPDIPAEHQEQEQLPGEPNGPTGDATMSWEATIAPEGAPTDDGRIFAPGAISWRDLPLSLGAMFDTPHADVVTASPVIGRIDEIWRNGSMIYASGVFDDSDLGREVARMVADGTLTGVSVDIAVSKMEIAWKSEILDAEGNWKGGDGPSAGDDGPDLVDILFESDPDDQVMYVVWEGKIGAVTICPFPAFAEASIKPASSLVAAASDAIWTSSQQAGWRVVRPSLAASAVAEVETPADPSEALTASVDAPLTPPAWWFDDPELHELTPLTLDDDGRIYGHLAPWDTCHIGIPGVCTTAPSSESGYAYFHLKEVECDGGERISCGTITLGTGHANRNLGRADAAAHYDNTGAAVADIVCGEDDHGIWYAGALRPYLDEKTVREFRGAAVSGDWRNVNGNLEFIALLACNVPGFPVPKVRAMVASGENGFEVISLTAAGIHSGQEGLTRDERAWFDALRDVVDGGWDEVAATLEEDIL